MPRPRTLAAALVAAALAAGCGGSSGGKSADPTPSAVTTSATPSPTLPPVATDTAAVKKALVKPADLGAPWIQPKAVNRVKSGKGEMCPGHKEDFARVKPRADESVALTEGKKTGAAIASFRVVAYDPAKVAEWSSAFRVAADVCKAYKTAEGVYVTTTVTDPGATFDGADEVKARLESVYAEPSHKTLYYVRQVIKVRYGRYVVTIEHAFIQQKTDPKGRDWTKTAKLLRVQVDKARASLGV